VTVTLKNGEEFKGIFSSGLADPARPQYTLKMVKRSKLANHLHTNGDLQLPDEYAGEGEDYAMTFDKDDVVDLQVTACAPLPPQPTQNGKEW
jgi:hypothetical protein